MANTPNEAIGILFEVDGKGDVNVGSGKRINGQLRHLVGQINRSNTVRLNFKIDESAIQKQLKSIQDKINALESGSGSGKKSNKPKQDVAAYNEAKKAIKEYYDLRSKYDRKSSRTTNADEEYVSLKNALVDAKKEFDKYVNATKSGEVSIKKNLNGISEAQRNTLKEFANAQKVRYEVGKIDVDKNAASAWGNLTQKVHDYIDRVEYAASRDEKAADGLRELRQMANNTDYHGYDELKKKLAEIEQYINKNGLATETWGQKFVKTFGSRVRSALAGIVTAKIGQSINNIYKNVVNLDKAMTDLQIASGKTRAEIKELTIGYSELAREIGATTVEVAESADTWLRQGYVMEETNALIKNSMMLSKLGKLESAEASTALTSAMKGYNIAAKDSIAIVDKWTAVDMAAAASAGDLATAMAETSTGARIAGVSMDKLIGYIATVKEVTQDGAESVGTFYKTLFARMNNVAAGNFIDDETGESLNDVETVLANLGIALRDANGLFKNSGDVLDEVAAKWNGFNNVQQHAIATAFAGTRQQEKFIALMENYGSATKYAEIATNSAGTAQEKYTAYTESLEGKLASLTATFEQLSQTVLSSDWIIVGVEILNGVLSVLNQIMSVGGGFISLVVAMSAAILALTVGFDLAKKSINKLILKHAELAGVQIAGTVTAEAFTAALGHMASTGILGVILLIPRLIIGMISLIAQFGFAKVAALGFKGALDLLKIDPIMLAITALIGVVAGACVAINNYKESVENAKKQDDQAIDAISKKTQELKEEEKTLDDLVDRYHELAVAAEGAYDAEMRKEILEIQEQIAKITGEEAQNLDLVNQSYNNLGETMKSLYGLQARQASKSIEVIKRGISVIRSVAEKELSLSDGQYLRIYSTKSRSGKWNSLPGITDSSSIEDVYAAFKENKEYYKTLGDIVGNSADHVDNALDIDAYYSKLSHYYNIISAQVSELTDSVINLVDAQIRSGDIVFDYGGDNGIVDTIEEYAQLKIKLAEAASASEHLAYVTEKDVLDAVERFVNANYADEFAKISAEIYKTNYQLKGFAKLVDSLTGEWDAMEAALKDMEEFGVLSVGSVEKLKELLPDIVDDTITLASGEQKTFLEETATGYYKLNGTLEDYIALKKEELVAVLASNVENSSSYQNALKDLTSLMSVFNTLSIRKEIEKETEILNEQVSRFEEMIDLRKELLNTYKKEVDYQNELAKKQKSVYDLQTELAVSRLDNSAAGQARTRELELMLSEAEAELEEYTLEHAVDDVVNNLEAQKIEYKALINEHINTIAKRLQTGNEIQEDIRDMVNEYIRYHRDADYNKARNELQGFITANNVERGGFNLEAGSSQRQEYDRLVGNVKNAYEAYHGGDLTDAGINESFSWYTQPVQDPNWFPDTYQYKSAVGKHSKSDDIVNDVGENFKLAIGNVVYRMETGNTVLSAEDSEYAKRAVVAGGGSLTEGTVIVRTDLIDTQSGIGGKPFVYTKDGHWVSMRPWKRDEKEDYYMPFLRSLGVYHTGGFVGGASALQSNEEFAKLIKGEFVSTPTQMERFMKQTLPSIANYDSSKKNEFNAPLISIECQNVTQDAFPKLKTIVEDAVREIKRQLDSGMSRTGYKKSTKTI